MGVVQSSAVAFPYQLKNEKSFSLGHWTLREGKKMSDSNVVSIFTYEAKNQTAKTPLASNCFKRFKTLRHPNLLALIDGLENETGVNIVTEEVFPLEQSLEEAKKFPNSIVWGIYQITKGLAFLNNDCQLVHGNVTSQFIFVNKAGDWKLGGFDLVSSIKDPTSLLRSNPDFVPSQYKSPEYQKGNWELIENSPVFAIDSWMLACLIYEIYNGKLTKTEDLKKVGKIPKEFLNQYQQLLTSSPKSRLDPAKFLQTECFNNSYVETCLFLENIALKEPFEKDKFFKKLGNVLDQFPKSCCKYKILPHLIEALDFGAANSTVLAPVLQIGKELNPEEYNQKIIPSVVKWFSSPERSMRVNLLQNLETFVEHLSSALINDQIFPNVVNGFIDTSPALRELTVKSMLYLVPKMNENSLNTMLRCMAKLQMDQEAGIRTNTTICLAKISQYLNKSLRDKVLIPAFSRALKDPYPRTRIAGLMSLSSTQFYYSKEDCAQKIIPVISPLTIDPEKEVRDQAFKTLSQIIEKLHRISETSEEVQAQVEQAAQNDANVLSWALGSISKKIYGAKNSTSSPQENTAPTQNKSTTTILSPSSNMARKESKTNETKKEIDGWDVEQEENVEPKGKINSSENKNESGWDIEDELEEREENITPKTSQTNLSQKAQSNTTSTPLLRPAQKPLQLTKTTPISQKSTDGWDEENEEEWGDWTINKTK